MKTKLSAVFILVCIFSVYGQSQYTSLAGKPGAFSRLGFGARGMAMGNAMSSVAIGSLTAYYNPALSVFQEDNSFQLAYSLLSLDRSLNFLSYTRKFEFGGAKDTSESNKKTKRVAGLSIGAINAGVGNIDGRDNQGIKTGDLSVSENQFYISVANKFSEKIAIGITMKFYYYSLYEDLSTTSFGVDFGAIYSYNDNLRFSFYIGDLNSKYKWDSGKIFGTQGRITEDKFPIIRKFGTSYFFENYSLLTALEFEMIGSEARLLKIGGEYQIYENLYLRAGIDKYDLKADKPIARPSFGFSVAQQYGKVFLGVEYAYVVEPYSINNAHIIGVNFKL